MSETLKLGTKMRTIDVTVNAKVEIDEEDLSMLLATAFEGGSTYWATKVKWVITKETHELAKESRLASDYLARGGSAWIYIDDYEPSRILLTPEKLMAGIKKYLEFKGWVDFQRIMDGDANDADSVLQMALFDGEIIFG